MSGAMDTNVTAAFLNAIPECRAYIESYGETPSNNLIVMASQVCLLRAMDIAQQAEALDISDEDSLQEIELSEAASQSDNTPDNYSALSFQVQAAVKIVLDTLATQVQGGRMCNLIALLRGDTSDTSLNGFSASSITTRGLLSNNADGDDDSESTIDIGVQSTGSTGPIDIGSLAIANPQQTVSDDTYSANAGSSSSSSSTGVIGFLSGIVGDATSLSSAVKSVSTTAIGTGSSLSNLVNNLGSGTLATYVKNNQTTIWFAAIAIVVVIVIAIIYAGKRK